MTDLLGGRTNWSEVTFRRGFLVLSTGKQMKEGTMITRIRIAWLVLPCLILVLVGLTWAQPNAGPPGNTPGTEHDVIVTPGATPGSLSFTYSGCTSNCDERPVKASGRNRRTRVVWRFRFAGERIVLAQINFTGGTPFFQERQNRSNRNPKFYDDHSASLPGQALGFAEISKTLKAVNWRRAEGVTEIEDGDEFKYDVVVITETAGVTKVYVADPIVIVRGTDDGDGR